MTGEKVSEKQTVSLVVKSRSGERIITCEAGETLLDALKAAGVFVAAPCGGGKRCGKCKAFLESDNPAPVSEEERALLSDGEIAAGIRLLCCQTASCDAVITIDEGEASIATDGLAQAVAVDEGASGHGIAVDIGTTTVVAYLIDLASGAQMGVKAELNAQRAFGADVISRAAFAETGGAGQLSGAIRSQIGRMAQGLCESAGVSAEAVARFSVVGNTIMLHLLLERPVSGIVRAPFTPDFVDGKLIKAVELGWAFPNAVVQTLPCISGFVGADTVSAVLACGMDEFDGNALLLDIGTNGEIVLGGKGGMICCSAAAGPAFEGAHISCGTGAVAGAVSEVTIINGVTSYKTIGGGKPSGICGSGLLDAIAALLDAGAVWETGAFDEESPLIGNGGRGLSYTIADNVEITQGDIRQVQLAKSAIASGVEVLLRRRGLRAEDVERVYLAGGFGSFLSSASAIRCGLLNSGFAGKIQQAGNAAGAGAVAAMISAKSAKRATLIAEKTIYVELSQSAEFNELFIENMMFDL